MPHLAVAVRPRPPVSIFFGRDRGMVFFLAFLVVTTVLLPVISLPPAGRVALSAFFGVTISFGAFATIRHRFVIYLVIALSLSQIAAEVIAETRSSQAVAEALVGQLYIAILIASLVGTALQERLAKEPREGARPV